MAMLAEVRRKQKISVNPRGNDWSNDENKFGQKLMEKMGWSKGKGLGAHEDGRVQHVAVAVKNDNRGVGCSKSYADNWIAHQDDFNDLLASLNQDHSSGADNSRHTEVISLESKSKSSKSRVHYHKFTKGKDLSVKSKTDLDCVFGKRQKRSNLTDEQENSESSDETEDDEHKFGIKTVQSTDSIQEYFAKKMAKFESSKSDNQSVPTDQSESRDRFEEENPKELDGEENECIEKGEKKKEKDRKKKKDKKKKKSKDSVSFQLGNDDSDSKESNDNEITSVKVENGGLVNPVDSNEWNEDQNNRRKKSKLGKRKQKELDLEGSDLEKSADQENIDRINETSDVSEETKSKKKKSRKKDKTSREEMTVVGEVEEEAGKMEEETKSVQKRKKKDKKQNTEDLICSQEVENESTEKSAKRKSKKKKIEVSSGTSLDDGVHVAAENVSETGSGLSSKATDLHPENEKLADAFKGSNLTNIKGYRDGKGYEVVNTELYIVKKKKKRRL